MLQGTTHHLCRQKGMTRKAKEKRMKIKRERDIEVEKRGKGKKRAEEWREQNTEVPLKRLLNISLSLATDFSTFHLGW